MLCHKFLANVDSYTADDGMPDYSHQQSERSKLTWPGALCRAVNIPNWVNIAESGGGISTIYFWIFMKELVAYATEYKYEYKRRATSEHMGRCVKIQSEHKKCKFFKIFKKD
jgi:hypothetical protein